MRPTWDIFCNVVDNYGDIGIAWRLARGLVGEHGLSVRLWVDDLHAFQRIWPAIDLNLAEQSCEGVTVCAWRTPFAPSEPARVVIEAFGCALPEAYFERDERAVAAAGVDQSRIPERRTLGGRTPRFAIAAPAFATDQIFFLSWLYASHWRAACRGGSGRAARPRS